MEIGEPFVLGETGPNVLAPSIAYREPEVSCGPAFDLESGDNVAVRAAERGENAGGDCPSCYFIRGQVTGEVSRTTLSDGGPRFGSALSGRFESHHRATYGNGCMGTWDFGLADVIPLFRERFPDRARTNVMAYRTFRPLADAQACTMPKGEMCWDTWFVRVVSQAGQVVAE